MIAIVNKTGAAIDNVAKQSDKLGIPTEKLAALGHAAEQTGISTNNMTTGLQRMTRRIAEAGQGTGTAVKALGDLGISIDDIVALSPDEQFLMIADAMENIKGQSDKVKLAFKLFDTEGVDLINTMNGGSEAVLKLMKDAENLGLTFTREEAEMVEASRDATDRMKKVFTGLFNSITIQLAPFVEQWANSMTEMGTSGESMADRVTKAIRGMVASFGWLKERLLEVKGIMNLIAAEDAKIIAGFQAGLGFTKDAIGRIPQAFGMKGRDPGGPQAGLGQGKAMQELAHRNPELFAHMVSTGQFGQGMSDAAISGLAVEDLTVKGGQGLINTALDDTLRDFDESTKMASAGRAKAANERVAKAAEKVGEALEKSIGGGTGIGPMTEGQWEVALLRSAEPAITPAMAAKALKAVKRATKGLEKAIGAGKGIGPMTEAQWETDLLKDLDPRGFSPREAAPEWQQAAQKKWLKMRGLKPLKFAQIGEAAVFNRPKPIVEPWEVRRLQALDRGLQKFADPAGSVEEVRRRRALGLTRTEERFRMRQQREKLEDQVKARRRRADRLKEKELQINADKNKTLTDILAEVKQIAASKFIAFAE